MPFRSRDERKRSDKISKRISGDFDFKLSCLEKVFKLILNCISPSQVIPRILKLRKRKLRLWYKRHHIENFTEQDPTDWTDFDFQIPTKESEQIAEQYKYEKYNIILKMCDKI